MRSIFLILCLCVPLAFAGPLLDSLRGNDSSQPQRAGGLRQRNNSSGIVGERMLNKLEESKGAQNAQKHEKHPNLYESDGTLTPAAKAAVCSSIYKGICAGVQATRYAEKKMEESKTPAVNTNSKNTASMVK